MGDRAQKILAFGLAGVALIGLASVPSLRPVAVGVVIVLGVGVALTHAQDVVDLSTAFQAAVGHKEKAA